jgi:hypothetical protein
MQSVNFHVGAGVTGLSGLAAWSVDNATGAGPRLIGVNIDIFDSANQLVVSDAFVSSQGGFASSMFSSTAWTEGDYRLVARGTAVRDAMFDLALTFDGIAQGVPSVSSGGLPVQGPNTAEQAAYFGQLQDTRTITSSFMAGDSLLVDSLVTDETGLLTQTTGFTVGPGVTGIHAGIAWMVSASAGFGPRLLGFNVDVFDEEDSLVMSDLFQGLTGGLARSTLSGALGPGSYTLRATGAGVRAASIDMALSFTGTVELPPGQVPESGSVSLAMAALVGLSAVTRRRRARNSASLPMGWPQTLGLSSDQIGSTRSS